MLFFIPVELKTLEKNAGFAKNSHINMVQSNRNTYCWRSESKRDSRYDHNLALPGPDNVVTGEETDVKDDLCTQAAEQIIRAL